MFREIQLLYEGLGAMNFVLPIAKTCKEKSILFCKDGNDICSEIDERIVILPNLFNMKISLNLKNFFKII